MSITIYGMIDRHHQAYHKVVYKYTRECVYVCVYHNAMLWCTPAASPLMQAVIILLVH